MPQRRHKRNNSAAYPLLGLGMKQMLARMVTVVAVAAGLGLGSPAVARAGEPGDMTKAEAAALGARAVPRGRDGKGWGAEVFAALERNGIRPTRSNICSVMTIIEQESTYTANPEVKGLGKIAEREVKARVARLPLPAAAVLGVNWFLASKPSPEKSYLKLIRAARTERDLDLVFRNMAFFLFREFATTRLLNSPPVARRVDAINPVSTLGSMQVAIAYVIAEAERQKGKRLGLAEIWKLRDELYTRDGGVTYGARMLLGYRAGYDSRLYVFADFNAGRYASRNAAFQHMVAELSGEPLALDGDLLIYESGAAQPQPSATEKALRKLSLGLKDAAIREDLLQEKEYAFRSTTTYSSVAAAFEKKTGQKPPHAMLPQIRLKSPKIKSRMTTEIFARAVMARYDRCMKAK